MIIDISTLPELWDHFSKGRWLWSHSKIAAMNPFEFILVITGIHATNPELFEDVEVEKDHDADCDVAMALWNYAFEKEREREQLESET